MKYFYRILLIFREIYFDETLTGITNPGQSGPGSNSNDAGVIHTPKKSRTRT